MNRYIPDLTVSDEVLKVVTESNRLDAEMDRARELFDDGELEAEFIAFYHEQPKHWTLAKLEDEFVYATAKKNLKKELELEKDDV